MAIAFFAQAGDLLAPEKPAIWERPNGLIAAETAASVTLRRAEKAEDFILRSQIESIQATAKSLVTTR